VGKVVDFAKSKFAHILTGNDAGDPLKDLLPAIFCKAAHRLEIPDLCGRPTSSSDVYFVDVLPISAGPVFDVVALSDANEVFSLLDADGMSRWVRDERLTCSSKDEFLLLALTHLRLIYSPRQAAWAPPQLCAAFGDAETRSKCQSPEIVGVNGGFEMHLRVQIRPGEELDSWANWRFELTERGYRGVRVE
jgi:hypothetical protein